MWQSQRVGQLLSNQEGLKTKVFAAVQRLMDGQAALAEGDYSGGTQAFGDAQALIQQTRNELNDALSASQYVLSVLDFTGTVRSGENVLTVTDELSAAGTHIAAVAERLSQSGPLTDAIAQSKPDLEAAAKSLDAVDTAVAGISVSAVPAQAQDSFKQLQAAIPHIRSLVDQAVSQSDVILSLLGAQHDRQYLVLLANNDELRPVGGFIGTVALVNVDRGKVENVDVSSVYDGDGQLKQFIAPPTPLLPIVSRWYLRDTNWFVDFPVSARKAAELFEKEGGPTVDGVILMTPQVIGRILQATGPIIVPGYDQTVTADNFVDVTQDEVTYNYDEELNKPKQFLADLTPILLQRAFTDSDKKLQTLGAVGAALSHKEMLLYFRDDAAEKQVEDLGWSGNINRELPGILHVNNANIGGHKSDQFIEQEIDQRVQVNSDGSAEVTLTTRRTHKGPVEGVGRDYPENENPAQKDNVVYQRVLVPPGSELLEAKGFSSAADIPHYVTQDSSIQLSADPDVAAWEAGQKTDSTGTTIGSEAGYTFFGNWVVTQPGQTSVTLYRYRIPSFTKMPGLFNQASHAVVSYVKQPGQQRTSLRVEISVPSEYRIIKALPDSGITKDGDSSVVYRGDASEDQGIGVVFERK